VKEISARNPSVKLLVVGSKSFSITFSVSAVSQNKAEDA
jgi:hypothetical protein